MWKALLVITRYTSFLKGVNFDSYLISPQKHKLWVYSLEAPRRGLLVNTNNTCVCVEGGGGWNKIHFYTILSTGM